MGARAYSERLGVIDDRQFQAALARLGLGDFVRADPIAGGLFGQNVFVTSTTGEWVPARHAPLRLAAPRRAVLLRAAPRANPGAAPWPYLIDPREDIFGWCYAIMPRMPGLQLSDPGVAAGLTREDRLGIARAMAENLSLMQELTWPHHGGFDLASGTIAPFLDGRPGRSGSWRTCIDGWSLARQHSDRTTDADVGWVDGVLQAARQALAEPFQPCFVMHDYKEQNATFERAGDGWRVSGIFDLMEAFFGDGEVDLSRQAAEYAQEDPELARAFVRRYLELRPVRPGFEERFLAYLLRDRLVIWEYFQRPGPGYVAEAQRRRSESGWSPSCRAISF